jgi:hypothetical protein
MVEVFGTPAACFGAFALPDFALAERFVCFFGVVIILASCVAWPDRTLRFSYQLSPRPSICALSSFSTRFTACWSSESCSFAAWFWMKQLSFHLDSPEFPDSSFSARSPTSAQ